MGSATVRAQQLANETNIALQEEANQWNYDIAHEANLWNWNNLVAQNEWNIQQWNRENAYNDPSAQVERLAKAGINPLWAMTGGDPGTAAHLESAEAQPAQVARMEAARVNPEYDPYLAQHVGNIVTSARDMVNGAQSAYGLMLQSQDVDTRKNAQLTRSALDLASAGEKRAAQVGRDIENQWSLSTFDVRAQAESQKLRNMEQQYNVMQKDSELAQAKKLEIEEHKKLITEQINQVIQDVRQRWTSLQLQARSIAVQEGQLELGKQQYNLSNERFSSEIQQWNNQNLLQFMYKFGRSVNVDMGVKVGGSFGSFSTSGGMRETLPADQAKAIECGITVLQRAASDPSNYQNMKDAEEAARIMNAFKQQSVPLWQQYEDNMNFNSTNSSIINPPDAIQNRSSW